MKYFIGVQKRIDFNYGLTPDNSIKLYYDAAELVYSRI